MKRLSILLLALVSACHSLAPTPAKHGFPLPSAKQPVPDRRLVVGKARKHNHASILHASRIFDDRFRDKTRNYGSPSKVRGVDKLRYPQTDHPRAAAAYLALGYRAAAEGDVGGAARAFWAALGLTGRSNGSRLQRERLRASAYRGMAGLAEYKGQHEWAALLRLLEQMARAYAASEPAKEAHGTFYADLKRFERRQRRLERQRKKAARAAFWQKVGAVVTAVGAGVKNAASKNTNPAAINQQSARLAKQVNRIERLDRATQKAYGAGMKKIGAGITTLRAVIAKDLPDIEAGREFVAQQVAWYLLTADDPRIYVKALTAYGSGRRGIDRAVARLEQATDPYAGGTPEPLEQVIPDVVAEILAAERFASQFERVDELPSPGDADEACQREQPASRCYLTLRAICRAGILNGCVNLSRLLRNKKLPLLGFKPMPAAEKGSEP